MKKVSEGFCNKPDRDVHGTVCGYPLPCPYHTIIMDMGAKPVPTITIPATIAPSINKESLDRLKRVAIALDETKEVK